MRRTAPLFVGLLHFAVSIHAQTPPPQANDAEPLTALGDTAKLSASRDEAAQDRIAATALLAHGRMLQQRRDFSGALHRYQRAFRYDDRQRGLKEIVALAIETGRTEQAARYAVLGGHQIRDLIVLRRLAVDATNRRNWKLAAQLYEASLSPADTEAGRSATQVLLQAEFARLSYLSGNYERAAQAFTQVRAALAKPEDYDLSESLQKIIIGDRRQTYTLMADVALEAKQYDEAAVLFREAYRDAPESEQAVLAQARVAQRRGDDEIALKLFTQVLEKGSEASASAVEPLRQLLAKIVTADKVEAAVEEKLAPVQVAHPENESLRRLLAKCRLDQSKIAEAEALLTDAKIEKPSTELQLLLAEVHRQQKSPDKWLAVLSGLAAGTSITAIESEARRAAKDDDLAAAVLQAAAGARSESAAEKATQGVAAIVALERKQYNKATKYWEASLPAEAAEKGRLLLLWGLRLTQADQYDRSVVTLQRVVQEKLVNDLAPAYYYLAGAAAFANQHEVALEAARAAHQLRPNDLRFVQREAWVHQHAKKFAEGRAKYEELLKRFEKSTDSSSRDELRQARLLLSTICLELGDEAAAIERIEEVLDEFPEDIGAMNDLGYLWADRGLHLQRSLRMVQRAVAAEPENRAYRDSLGWALLRSGRVAEAVTELETATSGEQPSGLILSHLGDALAQDGRPAEAKTAWQRAIDTFRQAGNEQAALAIEKKITQEHDK